MKWIRTPSVGYCAPLGAGQFAWIDSHRNGGWRVRVGRPLAPHASAHRRTLREAKDWAESYRRPTVVGGGAAA